MTLLPSSLLLFLLLVVPATADDACNAPGPIVLPVGNVSVTDTGVTKWGVKAQVGSPPQTVVPSINPDWNNTSLWSHKMMCGELSRPVCAWRRGGSLESKKSDSFRDTNNHDIYEFRAKDGKKLGISPWGTDNWMVNSSTVLNEFQIWSRNAGMLAQNAIGLGRNSSFLNTLAQKKYIASPTWSLFWGWQGRFKGQQMEGNFVMGGYDKAKTEGKQKATMDFSNDIQCSTSLMVTVKDITIKHVNGDETSLLGGGEGAVMRTCLKPDLPMITLPKSAFEKFNKSLPGTYHGPSEGMYNNGMNIDPKDSFVGDMTFKLVDGLKVTVPNHQLVLPNIAVDNTTGDQFYMDDNKTIMIHHKPVSDMPILGQAFLSSAYLHVDNHEKQFSLWEAKATDKMQLITVEHSEGGKKKECENTESQSPSSSDSDEDSDNAEDGDEDGGKSSSLSGGAIAGIVIGVVAGVALIAAAIWWFLIRRRRQQNAQAWGTRGVNGDGSEKSRPPEDALENNAGAADMKVLMSSPEELDGGQGHKTLPEMSVREGSAMELPGDTVFPNEARDSEATTTAGERDMPRGGDRDSGTTGHSTDAISPKPISATSISTPIDGSGGSGGGAPTGTWGSSGHFTGMSAWETAGSAVSPPDPTNGGK